MPGALKRAMGPSASVALPDPGTKPVEDVGVEGEVLAGGQRELALARDFGIVGLNRDGQGLDQLLAVPAWSARP
jgi:hypothetical protein